MPVHHEQELSERSMQSPENPSAASTTSPETLLTRRIEVLLDKAIVISHGVRTLPDTDDRKIAFKKLYDRIDDIVGEISAHAENFTVPLAPVQELEQKISDVESALRKFTQ